MTPSDAMHRLDTLFAHVWMVRTFLKHSEEAEEDEELAEVPRTLYDCMLALGGPLKDNDPEAYLKQANKKFKKLQRATELFLEIQPEISTHTNFQMAARSLAAAVQEIGAVLEEARSHPSGERRGVSPSYPNTTQKSGVRDQEPGARNQESEGAENTPR